MKFLSVIALISSLSGVVQAATTIPLQGVWQTTCFLQGKYYQMQEIEIHEDIWDVTDRYAKDEYCQNIVLEKHTMFEVSPSVTKMYWDAKAIMTYMRPYTRELVNQFNEKQLCGQQNWKPGRRIEVGGKSCEGFTTPMNEQRFYSIYKTEGPKNNILYIGVASTDYDGLSEETRHREFSPLIFIREPSSLF